MSKLWPCQNWYQILKMFNLLYFKYAHWISNVLHQKTFIYEVRNIKNTMAQSCYQFEISFFQLAQVKGSEEPPIDELVMFPQHNINKVFPNTSPWEGKLLVTYNVVDWRSGQEA